VQGFMERGLIPFSPGCQKEPSAMVSQLIRRDRRKEGQALRPGAGRQARLKRVASSASGLE